MPLALLLSPDDQAVSAITSVLEEMSVTCERPLDGASAAQKLNSNRFDLVLVDCENLAAAKLIFDVCRNRKGAGRPVPVAVVDGRAGLPTAFRLGAELILTKPVAKDQARITIRTAISRVKREDAEQMESASPVAEKAVPAATPQESAAATSHQSPLGASDHAAPQAGSFAATASAGSSSLTSFSDPAPAFSQPPVAEMSAAVAEPAAAPQTNSAPAKGTASKLDSSYRPSSSSGKFSGDAISAESEEPKAKANVDEKAGVETKAAADTKITVAANRATKAPTSELEALSDQGETTASEPEQKSQKKQVQKQKTGHLVALFVLLVMCGGFYGAWTYEPGFQELAKAQINHLLVVLGMAPQPQPRPAPVPVKPANPAAKPSPGVPVQTVTPDAAQPTQPTATNPNAATGASSSPASKTPATVPASPSPAPAAPAPKSGTAGAPSAALPPASTIPLQVVPARAKTGVTRIELPPNAVEHPAATSGGKPAPKSPPQQ